MLRQPRSYDAANWVSRCLFEPASNDHRLWSGNIIQGSLEDLPLMRGYSTSSYSAFTPPDRWSVAGSFATFDLITSVGSDGGLYTHWCRVLTRRNPEKRKRKVDRKEFSLRLNIHAETVSINFKVMTTFSRDTACQSKGKRYRLKENKKEKEKESLLSTLTSRKGWRLPSDSQPTSLIGYGSWEEYYSILLRENTFSFGRRQLITDNNPPLVPTINGKLQGIFTADEHLDHKEAPKLLVSGIVSCILIHSLSWYVRAPFRYRIFRHGICQFLQEILKE